MSFKRMLGRALRFVAVPSVLASLTAFFIWHASHGPRGLVAKEARIIEIAGARVELARAVGERQAAERRVVPCAARTSTATSWRNAPAPC
jgi:hypothetical protein